jgi:alanyl-tRNA synthetase
VTGREAEQAIVQERELLSRVAERLGAQRPEQIEERVARLQDELAEREQKVEVLQRELARGQLDHLLALAEAVDGVQVLAAQVSAASVDSMREMSDWVRDRLGSSFVVLGAEVNQKPLLVAAATPDVVARGGHAGKVVGQVARLVGGGGGGRPDFAQAGGKDTSRLKEALASVRDLVREQIDEAR